MLGGSWQEVRAYVTDDCDIDTNRLEMFMGGNGDWYVCVVFQDDAGFTRRKAVRITTSGQRHHDLVGACANFYKALPKRED